MNVVGRDEKSTGRSIGKLVDSPAVVIEQSGEVSNTIRGRTVVQVQVQVHSVDVDERREAKHGSS